MIPKKFFRKNQKGQAILEMLLIAVMTLGIWSAVSKTLRKSGAYQKVFGDPWTRLTNTIEFGVPTDKNNAGNSHPGHPDRHGTRVAL